MSPRPSTAVPSVTTATELRLIVNWNALFGSAAIAIETRATPGVYTFERSVPVLDRNLGLDADLAAEVREERRVRNADDAHAVEPLDRAAHRVGDRIRGDGDRDVATW